MIDCYTGSMPIGQGGAVRLDARSADGTVTERVALKVVHINYNDSSGGAAKAALRLVEAQRRHGIESHMLVLKKQTDKSYVHTVGPLERVLMLFGNLLLQSLLLKLMGFRDDGVTRSTNLMYSFLPRKLRSLKPDLIHIHWIGNSTLATYQIARFKLPLVWTMHDMWTFCATEHYPEISRYAQIWNQYQLQEPDSSKCAFYVNRALYRFKKSCFSNQSIDYVAPSDWLKDCAGRSSMLAGESLHTVPNCAIDDVFRPMESAQCRRRLGLPENTKLLAFGAVNAASDTRKGFHLLRQALEYLAANEGSDFELLVFGVGDKKPELANLVVHSLGTVDDEQTMAMIYNAADVFVAPSLQDNLPNTVVEALSCGTACVAFDVGGMSDLLCETFLGVIVDQQNPRALAKGLEYAMSQSFSKEKIAAHARMKRGEPVVVEEYKKIYLRRLESQK